MEAVLDTLNQLYATTHQRVRADIQKLLARVPSLKPKEDTFVSNEGDSYLLVALVGTVPIRFRTNQYNIPVEVFVVRDYPEKPPLCFVRPTRGMEIRPRHKHVDSAGQCYTPYLSAWQPARSDLLGLVTDLQTIFSTDPPVYAKPPSSSSLSPSSSSPSSSAQQPPPPTVAAAAKPPATPPPAYSPVGTAYGSQHPPAYGPPPGQPAHMGGGYPGHPHPHHQPHQPPPFASGQPEGGRKRELEERMARKANDVWQAVSADVNQFHLVQQRLRDGSSWLQHSLTTLAHDKRELDEYLRAAEEKEHETRQWISESETVQLGVDDLVVPADALSAQMMELVAEDAGIEDTLYYMDKALHSNTIDLQTHLKLTRNLCREQFQKRALAMRVHELQKQRM